MFVLCLTNEKTLRPVYIYCLGSLLSFIHALRRRRKTGRGVVDHGRRGWAQCFMWTGPTVKWAHPNRSEIAYGVCKTVLGCLCCCNRIDASENEHLSDDVEDNINITNQGGGVARNLFWGSINNSDRSMLSQ